MNLNPERKERYIRITTRILEEEGAEGVTIRRVANEAHCTSAVLYKHFQNKDHLIMLASVPFLESYIINFIEQNSRTDITSIQMDLLLWKIFIREAFKNSTYYELMFFSENRETLEDCVFEYYHMFPNVQQKFDGLTASIIFSGNLYERELFRLRRAANEGLISLDNALLLSQLTVSVFNGVFIRRSDLIRERGGDQNVADYCYGLIRSLFALLSYPDTVLDVDET